MGGNVRKLGVHFCQETLTRIIIGSVLLQVNTLLLFSPSYLALLMLEYGNRIEKSQVTCHRAEEEGSPSEKQRELLSPNSSWTSTPDGALEPPTSQLSCMRCSFTLQDGGRKRQNICAAEAAKAASQNLILRWINLPWSW